MTTRTRRPLAIAMVASWCFSLSGCRSARQEEPSMTATTSISVQSPAFGEGQPIPRRYTCDGENVSPPLRWTGIPAGTGSVAVVVDDPDAPAGTYTHWVVVNIAPTITSFDQAHAPPNAQQVVNSAGKAAYTGPCPPAGTHHYRFTVYALPAAIEPRHTGSLAGALKAIRTSATAQGRLVGTYAR
jgi:Raf kinase inhibitor-like YbhB/YbcL family protein